MLKQCQFLLGVHLSDNDLTKCSYNYETNNFDYDEQFYECTKQFGITLEDLKCINRYKKEDTGKTIE